MGLQYLDKNLLGQYLACAWKRQLNTNEDPANGKWYQDGANHDGVGLYGGLTDQLSNQLIFDEDQKTYTPQSRIVDTAVVDNRNGLAPQSTVQLSYSYANSQSSTHSTTAALKVGAGVDIKASATIFGVGADVTTKFSIEFSYSWTDSTTETKTQTQTFSQSVPVNVPTGKVYQVVLSATTQQLTVPYRALVYVNGKTETWFEDRIQGHYNWFCDAGTMFSWINQYGCAGAESHTFSRNPNNGSQGIITQSGTLTAQQTANFVARIYDITASYQGESVQAVKAPEAAMAAAASQAPVPQGILVKEIPF